MNRNLYKTSTIVIKYLFLTTSLTLLLIYWQKYKFSFNSNPTLHLNELYDREIIRCQRFRTVVETEFTDSTEIKRRHNKKTSNITCFSIRTNSLPEIYDIDPRPDKSIFFHETSCNSYNKGKITINSRQACAVESAARLNPNLDVYLLYSSPGDYQFMCEESDLFLQALLSYENVKIMYLDFERFIRNTSVVKLYSPGRLRNSKFDIQHTNDIIRYITLSMYGGISIDLDVILTKSLEQLELNFAALPLSNNDVPVGVLSFNSTGEGHKWSKHCLDDLGISFNGKILSDSGSGVLNRLLDSICVQDETLNSDCFTLFPANKFYSFQDWKMFSKDKLQYIIDNSRNSYAIYNGEYLSTKIDISDTQVPYLYFAEQVCPKVLKACGNYF